MRFYRAGNYPQALRCFSAAHDEDPDNPETIAALLDAFELLDREDEADKLFEMLIDSRTGRPEFFSSVGDIAYARKKHGIAERYYAKSLSGKQDHAVRRRYAEVLAWQKKYILALDQIGLLQKSGISDSSLLEFKADVLSWNRQYEDAVRDYLELYEAGKGGDDVFEKLKDIIAFSLWDGKRLDFYLEILDRDAFAEEDSLKFLLARSFAGNRRYEDAKEILEKLHLQSPSDKRIALQYVSVLENLDLPKKTYAVIERCLESNPEDRKLLERYAAVAEAFGDAETALDVYYRLLAAFPEDSLFRLKTARTLVWAGRYGDALPLYKGLVDSGEANQDFHDEYVGLLFREKKYREIVRFYKSRFRAADLAKADAFRLADAYLAMNDRFSALEVYEQLQRRFPEDREVVLGLARVHSWEGNYETSMSLYVALRASGYFPDALAREYADVLFWSGSFRKAADEYARLLRSGRLDEKRLKNYAEAQIALGRYAESAEIYRSLLEKHKDEPGLVRGYASALAGTEQFDRAEELYSEHTYGGEAENPFEHPLFYTAAFAALEFSGSRLAGEALERVRRYLKEDGRASWYLNEREYYSNSLCWLSELYLVRKKSFSGSSP
ncbi:tetratricopeptide repeat protein [Prosthecochloris sp. GSB1]|uniref:tetratricopeptide repeat protein n=1 Tax=Prosthecochloris sp. GSB1 TaxID=281093 RepID=UPI00142DFBD6|nr:tetratricopeptide repeat protein [Prosthecochloris sp. GSB1]